MECQPPAATSSILSPAKYSTSFGSLLLSTVPCPNCPRLGFRIENNPMNFTIPKEYAQRYPLHPWQCYTLW